MLESDAIPDNTWLPISHPDHSLGAGLGPPSEDDGEERETDDDVADSHNEGELPWTPQFGKVGTANLNSNYRVQESVCDRSTLSPLLRKEGFRAHARLVETRNAPRDN